MMTSAQLQDLRDRHFRFHPAHLPTVPNIRPSLRKLSDQGAYQTLAAWVLDGILEVEQGGHFYSGPYAVPYLVEETDNSPPEHRPTQLSLMAIQQAQSLPITDAGALATWLYQYHRQPLSIFWAQRYPKSQELTQVLEAQFSRTGKDNLNDHFQAAAHTYWWMWNNRNIDTIPDPELPTFKLYISPQLDDLITNFPAIVRLLAEHQIRAFKLGKDLHGLLRPDKMIAYLDSRPQIETLANDLLAVLRPYRSQGVPFTAGLDPAGLLSWGMDPPRQTNQGNETLRESWRSWICRHLAESILTGKSMKNTPLEPWQFALIRLQLAGVQTSSWQPDSGLFT